MGIIAHVSVRPKAWEEIQATFAVCPVDLSGYETAFVVLADQTVDALAAVVDAFADDDLIVVGDPIKREVMDQAADDPRFDGVRLYRAHREPQLRTRGSGPDREKVRSGAPVPSWVRVR